MPPVSPFLRTYPWEFAFGVFVGSGDAAPTTTATATAFYVSCSALVGEIGIAAVAVISAIVAATSVLGIVELLLDKTIQAHSRALVFALDIIIIPNRTCL